MVGCTTGRNFPGFSWFNCCKYCYLIFKDSFTFLVGQFIKMVYIICINKVFKSCICKKDEGSARYYKI